MSEAWIETRCDGEVFHIILNRAEKRNALNLEMLEALRGAVEGVDREPGVRAVIVSAHGPMFSAGLDVISLGELSADAGEVNPARWLRRLAERMQHCLNAFEATEVPIIGALEGRVIGLGLELALSFDLRVGAENLQLSMPEARLGLVADVGGTSRLCRTIGVPRTKDMLMTAREISAAEALQWGLLNRVAPPGETLAAAQTLAADIVKNAPLAVGMAKRIVDQGTGLDLNSHMALERWAQSQLIGSEDVGEALSAFLEKRSPAFRGR